MLPACDSVPVPLKATYVYLEDKSMSQNPADHLAVIQFQGRTTVNPLRGPFVPKVVASKRPEVRGLSKTWFNPVVLFAL